MLSGVTLNCHNGCHEFRFPIRQNCNQCVCHYQAQCRVHIHTVTQCWVGLALSTNQEGGEGVSILGLGRNVVISFRSHNSLWNCCFHVIQIYFQKARKSLLFRWKVKHSHYLPNTAHTEPDLCSFEGHFHLYLDRRVIFVPMSSLVLVSRLDWSIKTDLLLRLSTWDQLCQRLF